MKFVQPEGNAQHEQVYISNTAQQINLHRPYIDDILVADTQDWKPKKVLAVHGYTGGPWKGSDGRWTARQAVLESR